VIRKVLLSLIVACVATCALAAPEPNPVYAKLQGTSVLVNVGDGCGTGVLVTKQVGEVTRSYVWTAGHVVVCLRQPDGTFKNPLIVHESREKGKLTGKAQVEAKVIAYSDADNGEDLALLEVLEDNFRPLAVSATFDLEADILPVGTELIHVGCTLGLYNSVSTGIISQTDRDLLRKGKMFDQTTCMGYPGSSGGGVFTANGTYIGMLTRGAGPGLNFIVPMRRIVPWAKQMGVYWALDPDLDVPSEEERISLPLTDGTDKINKSPFLDIEIRITEPGDEPPTDDNDINEEDPMPATAVDASTVAKPYARYHLRGRTNRFFDRVAA
jgi:hypothetical protein